MYPISERSNNVLYFDLSIIFNWYDINEINSFSLQILVLFLQQGTKMLKCCELRTVYAGPNHPVSEANIFCSA